MTFVPPRPLGPSPDDDCVMPQISLPHRLLRQTMALNMFKSGALGSRHVAGDPQLDLVESALTAMGLGECVDGRTWISWFKPDAPAAQRKSLEDLDRFLACLESQQGGQSDSSAVCPHPYFSDLVCKSLIQVLSKRTGSKQPDVVLRQRALQYCPPSPWHLHLDALEAMAIANGTGEVGGLELKECCARTVLSLLHGRWSPRHGTVYKQLSSDLALIWGLLGDNQRKVITDAYREKCPDNFVVLMNSPAVPEWDRIGIEQDTSHVHVHRLLFSLAASPGFLVADRFDNWWLDLVTAGLAKFALACTDPFNAFKDELQPEMIFWEAFESLLFRNATKRAKLCKLRRAMRVARAPWTDAAGVVLLKAGDRYRESLKVYGAEREVALLVDAAWKSAQSTLRRAGS